MLYARHRIQAKFYHQTGLVKRNSPCQIRQFPDGEGHFRRGLLVWVDHYSHSDRHERKETENSDTITRVFGRHTEAAL